MKNNLITALVFIIIAGCLFFIPRSFVSRLRLEAYGVYQSLTGSDDVLPENGGIDSLADSQKKQDYELKIKGLNQQLIRRDNEISSLKRELRELVSLREKLRLHKIISVKTLLRAEGDNSSEIVVDAGKKEGVGEGMAVAQGSALAGTVALTGNDASRVLLASHPGCIVPARSSKSRDTCSVKGDGEGGAVAVFYVTKTETLPGEKLLTSGLLGKLPEGLIIGTIDDYPKKGREAGTFEAPVRLEADFAALEQLIIISPETVTPPEKAHRSPANG